MRIQFEPASKKEWISAHPFVVLRPFSEYGTEEAQRAAYDNFLEKWDQRPYDFYIFSDAYIASTTSWPALDALFREQIPGEYRSMNGSIGMRNPHTLTYEILVKR